MKSKLRIGVWVEKNYQPEIGGGFGYYNQIMNLLLNNPDNRFQIKYISEFNSNSRLLNAEIQEIKLFFKQESII